MSIIRSATGAHLACTGIRNVCWRLERSLSLVNSSRSRAAMSRWRVGVVSASRLVHVNCTIIFIYISESVPNIHHKNPMFVNCDLIIIYLLHCVINLTHNENKYKRHINSSYNTGRYGCIHHRKSVKPAKYCLGEKASYTKAMRSYVNRLLS